MIATELALQMTDTPVCDCGKGNETVERFLLYCDKYHTASARCEMMDYRYMKDTSVCSRRKGRCSITECLLLAVFAIDRGKCQKVAGQQQAYPW